MQALYDNFLLFFHIHGYNPPYRTYEKGNEDFHENQPTQGKVSPKQGKRKIGKRRKQQANAAAFQPPPLSTHE